MVQSVTTVEFCDPWRRAVEAQLYKPGLTNITFVKVPRKHVRDALERGTLTVDSFDFLLLDSAPRQELLDVLYRTMRVGAMLGVDNWDRYY